MVSQDILEMVAKENQQLAKEIDNIKNQKIIQEIQSIVRKRYETYKLEFTKIESLKNTNTATLQSYAAYLWVNNRRISLKQSILADAYKEVTKSDIKLLEQDSSMMQALLSYTKSREEYPFENLVQTPQELEQFIKHCQHYKQMYLDAYVASA